MAGCLGNVLRGSHVTEPAAKDHVVSPDAFGRSPPAIPRKHNRSLERLG